MREAGVTGPGKAWRRDAGRRFDCGDGRMLTAREIASITGCSQSGVLRRVEKGWTGAELLRPLRLHTFDCGKAGMLTIAQICRRTGLLESAIRHRIARGITGAALIAPRGARSKEAAPRSSTMVTACMLANVFPDRLPTAQEIADLRPMSLSAAERWRATMAAARAQEAADDEKAELHKPHDHRASSMLIASGVEWCTQCGAWRAPGAKWHKPTGIVDQRMGQP